MNQIKKSVLALLLLLVYGISLVSAIGIGPGKVPIDFVPNLQQDMSFVALNNGDTDITYKIYTSGDLGKYINCSVPSLFLKVGESKHFICTIKLPNELPPGSNEGRVGIVEAKDVKLGQVSVLSAVESRIIVSVAYPDFYLAMSIDAQNIKKNEEELFKVHVKNWGKENVTLAAPIKILDANGKFVAQVLTTEEDIPKLGEADLYAAWKANVDSGKYTALAYYNEFNASKDFLVGEYLINIINLTSDITEGEIGKFELNLQSMWPEAITFNSELEVFDNNHTSLGSKTDEFIIRQWQEGMFKILWDKPISPAGTYNAHVKITYGNKTTEKNFDFQVKKKPVVQMISDNKTLVYSLIGIILLLLIFIIYKVIRDYMNRKSKSHIHHKK